LVENIFDVSDKTENDEYYKDYLILKIKIAKE
jgi:hypothetical protein